MMVARATLVAGVMLAASAPAYAHHEAMFGPQSSAVLSPGVFLSSQAFERSYGKGDQRRHETTTVVSAGVTPFQKRFSVALVVPYTFATSLDGASERGFEDALVSARYRFEIDGLARSLGLEEAYMMAVGGLEVPSGTLDHDFGRGPIGEIAAALLSVESRPLAFIAYAYYHHTGFYQGNQLTPGNFFSGGGAAYTPIDDDARGKLFSLQLGVSYERTFQVERGGMTVSDSGGWGTFMHPGVVFSTTPALQFFALTSIPLAQEWNALDDRQRFRVGAGVIWTFGNGKE